MAAIWSSPLARARQTAELLAPAGVAVRLDARLRERHVGSWSGLTRAEIEASQPGWLDAGRRPEGWEDDDTVRTRAWSALRTVAATVRPGDAAVVVSHGGLIRAVVAELGVAVWPVPNLGGVWLRRDGDGFELGPRASLMSVEPATRASRRLTRTEGRARPGGGWASGGAAPAGRVDGPPAAE